MKIKVTHGSREIEVELPFKQCDLNYVDNSKYAIELIKTVVESVIKMNQP